MGCLEQSPNIEDLDLCGTSVTDATIDALVRMFRYYDEEGFVGDPRPLAALLGRPANKLAAFLERSIREIRTGS